MNRLIFNVYVKVIFYVCIASICLLPSVKANSIEEIISKINTIENRIKVLEKATFNKNDKPLPRTDPEKRCKKPFRRENGIRLQLLIIMHLKRFR